MERLRVFSFFNNHKAIVRSPRRPAGLSAAPRSRRWVRDIRIGVFGE